MDKSAFTSDAPGQLVSVTTPRPDVAFVPDTLPPYWKFPEEMWPKVVQANSLMMKLDGIGSTLDNPLLLLRPLVNREAISSSSIEGTYVTPQQLLFFEIEPETQSGSVESREDWKEVKNYARALMFGFESIQDEGRRISLPLLRQMHSILMAGVRGEDKSPGEFRNCQVIIGRSGRFFPPPHEQVSPLMENLAEVAGNGSMPFDALVQTFIVHYQFETVHPFRDGNGRIGRVLLALMAQSLLGMQYPWLYLSEFFERHRDEYVERMFRVSTANEWQEWVEFCLQGTVEQAQSTITRCEQLRALKADFHSRVNNTKSRAHGIIESLFMRPMLTVTGLTRTLGVHYSTASKEVKQLAEIGILTEHPDSYPKAYISPEIMAVAYS